jgi:hypothetical protein
MVHGEMLLYCCGETIFELASAWGVMQVHGDAIMERPPLKAVAQRLHTKLRPVWSRLDDLLQECRCMVSFFGHLQQ